MKTYPKNSFFRKLFYRYIIVFLIPLLLSTTIYVVASVYIYQYSKIMLENELRNNEKFVEDLLMDLTNVYADMQNHSTIHTAMAGNVPTYTQYNALQNQFSLASSQSRGLFTNIFVYFDEADFIVDLTGGDTPSNYYQARAPSYTGSFELWQDMMSTFYTGNLVRTSDGILYLKSLNENAGQRAVTLGVEIPAATLTTRNSTVKLYGETNLILLDEENNVIFSSGDSFDSLNLSVLPDNDAKITYNGVRYIASRSSFYSFDYLILVKDDDIVAQLRTLLLTIIVVLLAAFFIGLLVIHRFVQSQTRPVQEILDLLNINGWEGKEFELIQQSISRNLHHIMQSRPFLADSFISHAIRGNVNEVESLEFHYEKFQLILLRTKDMGVYTPEDGDDTKLMQNLMYTAVTNIFDELLGSLGSVCHSIQGETLVFLLNTNAEAQIDDVEHIYRQIHDYLGVSGYVAISETCTDLNDLQTVYQESARALDGAEMRGRTGVRTGKDTAPAASGGYQKYINLFTNAVAGGQPDLAHSAVRDMIQTCAENHKNMNDVKFNLLTMINNAAQELERVSQTDVKSKLYESDIAYKVIEAKSSALLLEITDEFLTLVGMLDGVDITQTSLEERVANYIRTHYDDSNLNLKILADKFHISPAYLSRKFKARFDAGILDYLSSTRLESAKQKLLETDWSIDQISECCGYTNSVTFSRQFKSYTGMTPGHFRQIHKLYPPEE